MITITCHKATRSGRAESSYAPRTFESVPEALQYLADEQREHGEHAHSLHRDGRRCS